MKTTRPRNLLAALVVALALCTLGLLANILVMMALGRSVGLRRLAKYGEAGFAGMAAIEVRERMN